MKKNQQGITALLAVLIISAAGMLLARSMVFQGFSALEMDDRSVQSSYLDYLAESCVNDALLRIKKDASFSGGDYVFETENGACAYDLYSVDSVKEVNVRSYADDYQKEYLALISMSSSTISSVFFN